ncbi:MAG TPA: multicopper oxidase domain-containing protein [Chloroflexota bacterium]
MHRRQFVKLGLLGGAAALLPVAPAIAASRKNATPAGPVIPSFAQTLTIPPVLQPVRSDADTDYYQMTQEEARVEILSGLQTTIWGYNGSFPGPTIVARRGRQAIVTITNKLPLLGATKVAYVCGDMSTILRPFFAKEERWAWSDCRCLQRCSHVRHGAFGRRGRVGVFRPGQRNGKRPYDQRRAWCSSLVMTSASRRT